jgi:hypothetical protein
MERQRRGQQIDRETERHEGRENEKQRQKQGQRQREGQMERLRPRERAGKTNKEEGTIQLTS